jgi:hypothetical protein
LYEQLTAPLKSEDGLDVLTDASTMQPFGVRRVNIESSLIEIKEILF